MKNETCFLAQQDENWLWHKRLGHLNFDNLVKTSRKGAVRDIPNQNLQTPFANNVNYESKQEAHLKLISSLHQSHLNLCIQNYVDQPGQKVFKEKDILCYLLMTTLE